MPAWHQKRGEPSGWVPPMGVNRAKRTWPCARIISSSCGISISSDTVRLACRGSNGRSKRSPSAESSKTVAWRCLLPAITEQIVSSGIRGPRRRANQSLQYFARIKNSSAGNRRVKIFDIKPSSAVHPLDSAADIKRQRTTTDLRLRLRLALMLSTAHTLVP